MSKTEKTNTDDYGEEGISQTETTDIIEEEPDKYKSIEPEKDKHTLLKPKRVIIRAKITHDKN